MLSDDEIKELENAFNQHEENNRVWLKANNLDEKHTGRFFVANTGPMKGKTGEAVTFFGWGGVNLRFSEMEDPITYALGDVTETK